MLHNHIFLLIISYNEKFGWLESEKNGQKSYFHIWFICILAFLHFMCFSVWELGSHMKNIHIYDQINKLQLCITVFGCCCCCCLFVYLKRRKGEKKSEINLDHNESKGDFRAHSFFRYIFLFRSCYPFFIYQWTMPFHIWLYAAVHSLRALQERIVCTQTSCVISAVFFLGLGQTVAFIRLRKFYFIGTQKKTGITPCVRCRRCECEQITFRKYSLDTTHTLPFTASARAPAVYY